MGGGTPCRLAEPGRWEERAGCVRLRRGCSPHVESLWGSVPRAAATFAGV